MARFSRAWRRGAEGRVRWQVGVLGVEPEGGQALFRTKFGEEPDDEADSSDDADGTHWVKTSPCSATQEKASYTARELQRPVGTASSAEVAEASEAETSDEGEGTAAAANTAALESFEFECDRRLAELEAAVERVHFAEAADPAELATFLTLLSSPSGEVDAYDIAEILLSLPPGEVDTWQGSVL